MSAVCGSLFPTVCNLFPSTTYEMEDLCKVEFTQQLDKIFIC
jgi:hypothetical protein